MGETLDVSHGHAVAHAGGKEELVRWMGLEVPEELRPELEECRGELADFLEKAGADEFKKAVQALEELEEAQEVVAGTEVVGGGPEDPVADVAAGGEEVGIVTWETAKELAEQVKVGLEAMRSAWSATSRSPSWPSTSRRPSSCTAAGARRSSS